MLKQKEKYQFLFLKHNKKKKTNGPKNESCKKSIRETHV